MPRELDKPTPVRPSLYERGREEIAKAKPLGTFEAEGREPGLVLLIGDVDGSGEGVVRHLVRDQEAVLRRLVVLMTRDKGRRPTGKRA